MRRSSFQSGAGDGKLVVPRLPIPDSDDIQQFLEAGPLSPLAPQTPRLHSPHLSNGGPTGRGGAVARGSPRFGHLAGRRRSDEMMAWPDAADIGGAPAGGGGSLVLASNRGNSRRPNPLLGGSPLRVAAVHTQSPQKHQYSAHAQAQHASHAQAQHQRLSDRAMHRGSASSPNLHQGLSLETGDGEKKRESSTSALAALGADEKCDKLGSSTPCLGQPRRGELELIVSPLPLLPISPVDSMSQHAPGAKGPGLYQSPPVAHGREPRSSMRSSHGTPNQRSLLDSGAKRHARMGNSFMTMTEEASMTPETGCVSMSSPGEVEALCDKAQDLLLELRAMMFATPLPDTARTAPIQSGRGAAMDDAQVSTLPSPPRSLAAMVASSATPARPTSGFAAEGSPSMERQQSEAMA